MPAWGAMWDSVKQGEFSDAFSYAFLDQETVDASNKADSDLTRLIQEDCADGKITDAQAEESFSRIQSTSLPALFDNPEMSPALGFRDEMVEQVRKDMLLVEKGVRGTSEFILGAIPWQIYVIVGVVVILYVFSVIPKRAVKL